MQETLSKVKGKVQVSLSFLLVNAMMESLLKDYSMEKEHSLNRMERNIMANFHTV